MSSDQHKRCLNCGYILDGLPENRCPECGRAFDPDRPETYGYLTGKVYTGLLHVVLALFAPAILIVPWSVAGMLGGEPICLLSALTVALELYVSARSVCELLRAPRAQPWRSRWCLALLISLIMVLGCGCLLYGLAV